MECCALKGCVLRPGVFLVLWGGCLNTERGGVGVGGKGSEGEGWSEGVRGLAFTCRETRQ